MTNSAHYQALVRQDRYGLALAARLSEGAAQLPYDVNERLRAARVRAGAQRKLPRTQTASAVQASGGAATLSFGDEGLNLWSRIGSVLPLIVLLVGLVMINSVAMDHRTLELAEVDAALLTDDLPPSAYADPGFAQFLKAGLQSEE